MIRIFFFFVISTNVFSQTSPWGDLKLSIKNAWVAGKTQWQLPQTYGVLLAGSPLLIHSFERDDYYLEKLGKQKQSTANETLDALGTITNFNLIPISLYFYAREKELPMMRKFAMEVTSAWVLASVETVLLSLVRIHERPTDEEVGFWEKNFRGKSSFPSGHVLPSFILTIKTWDTYGAGYAVTPFLLSLAIAYERVQSRKHYVSDVVGSLVLAFKSHYATKKSQPQTVLWWPGIEKDYASLNLAFSW